jgi:SAM-dependent methyltransferase
MLRSLLRNFHRPAAPTPAEGAAEVARRMDAAAAAARAGRLDEAAAECKAVLALEADHSPAHLLLAAIAMPGEGYQRLLERIHAHVKPRTYLEIGVALGESIRLAGAATRAIGVDPEPRIAYPLGPNVRVVAQTSDAFFAGHDVRAELGGLPVDLALIDGMHRFEFALRDFMNIEALCAPAGTILIHDTCPLDERTAARERLTSFWSGDIWRLVLLLRKHRPDLVVQTIATAPTGLTLVRNLDPKSTYIRDHLDALIEAYLAVDYGFLGERKAEHLALFPNDWPKVRGLLDAAVSSPVPADPAAPAVLNVGGGSKTVPIPAHYAGWLNLVLDIDPRRGPDIVCDARQLRTLAPGRYDAVYCSHNLEHYFDHEVAGVLAGFVHVLKDAGFAEIRVPDMPAVFRKMTDESMDLGDVLYESPAGPIRVLDVVYGWSPEIERSGNDFFAHKTGFSRKSLGEALLAAGFAEVWNAPPFGPYELRALAFKRPPTPEHRRLFGIPAEPPAGA